MAAGLGVGVGEGADQAVPVEAAHDVLERRIVVVAQQRRRDRAQVHGVAHGGRGAAVARDGLHRHRRGHVVLAHAAQLFRHDEAEEARLGERLEVLARIDQLAVALDRVLAHRALTQVDQRLLQRLLLVGQLRRRALRDRASQLGGLGDNLVQVVERTRDVELARHVCRAHAGDLLVTLLLRVDHPVAGGDPEVAEVRDDLPQRPHARARHAAAPLRAPDRDSQPLHAPVEVRDRALLLGVRLAGEDDVGVLAPGLELLMPPETNVERRPDIWIANRLTYNNANRNTFGLRPIGVALWLPSRSIVLTQIRSSYVPPDTGFAFCSVPPVPPCARLNCGA